MVDGVQRFHPHPPWRVEACKEAPRDRRRRRVGRLCAPGTGNPQGDTRTTITAGDLRNAKSLASTHTLPRLAMIAEYENRM